VRQLQLYIALKSRPKDTLWHLKKAFSGARVPFVQGKCRVEASTQSKHPIGESLANCLVAGVSFMRSGEAAGSAW